MIKLDILSLLKAKGKSKYWLYKQLGMSYQNFLIEWSTMKQKSIRYENIEAMCFLLNCTQTTYSLSTLTNPDFCYTISTLFLAGTRPTM